MNYISEYRRYNIIFTSISENISEKGLGLSGMDQKGRKANVLPGTGAEVGGIAECITYLEILQFYLTFNLYTCNIMGNPAVQSYLVTILISEVESRVATTMSTTSKVPMVTRGCLVISIITF